jgi:hypothetical protein
MPKLWQSIYSKKDLQDFTSDPGILAGWRSFTYQSGRVRGMRGIDGWTGSGLRFTLWPDRALDLGPAWYADKPIAWIHPGLGHPAYYEPEGTGWLRTFGGGLLTTCGLTHFGAPDEFEGRSHGLHGRIANQPVEALRLWQEWRGEDYVLIAEAEVRQSVLFGENLLLRRRIETCLGSQTIHLKDQVINQSSRPSPVAVLYHCNLGFPLVSPESVLQLSDIDFKPRDKAAQAGAAAFDNFELPQAGYEEQVFFHWPEKDQEGYARAFLFNPALNYGLELRWLAETMPVLTQWKMMGQNEYVCGLEPATHAMGPREMLAQKGLPHILPPGASIDFEIQLSVIDNI